MFPWGNSSASAEEMECLTNASSMASIIRRSAVTGADFLAFETAPNVAKDLNMSIFVARKMLELRDSHLR